MKPLGEPEVEIEKETVAKLAKELRIELSPEEITTISRDLSKILSYVKELTELDLGSWNPTYSLSPNVSKFREDTNVPSLPLPEVKSNLNSEDDFVKAPRV
jgi:aspartyl/glutamyl-tRNA(Asn/Gln) amidotransferase C subunit